MSDWKQELRDLVELKDIGAITQQQFEEKRDKILKRSDTQQSSSMQLWV